MFIYTPNKQVVIGPIKKININSNTYFTDMVYGDSAIIEVEIPNDLVSNEFSINIDYISYGIIQSINEFMVETEQSANCDIDVNDYPNWSDVKKGVGLIFIGGESICSGSLIADECNSRTPYFLTANHCFDPQNSILGNWSFKFNYEEGAGGNAYIIIDGAKLRASYGPSDFLLLELTGNGARDFDASYFNEITHDEFSDGDFACIHHPQGEFKKIALASYQLNDQNNGSFWKIKKWNKGILMPGSSGAPLFNSEHKIIGQLQRGVGYCNGYGGTDEDESGHFFNTFGKTEVSWDGGGTESTSLSAWLSNVPKVTIEWDFPTCQLNNGIATAIVECGISPFDYLWSTGETTQTIENLSPGIYSVTVTDADGSTAVEFVMLEPEIIVPASDPSWQSVLYNNSLNPQELQNRSIYVEDQLNIDVDYTFSNVTFSFADYGGLTIKEGINVDIKDLDGNKSILKACDADWRGVWVEHNAILTMENSEILNAYIGITTNRSDINLSHVDIIGNQGYAGIRTIGSMEGGTYETNIYNYRTGIYSLSNSKYPYFVKGEITNCTYGVSLIHSPGAIFNYEIEAYENPIVLLTSPGSIVGIIKFQAGIIGINAYNSSNLQIYKNDSENSNLETFAYLKNCPNSEISGNWNITARQYGIKALNSNLLKIADNNINVDGIPYIDGGAVKLTDCSSCTIQGNTIDANQCSFGIEYINGSGSDISDNNISVFSSISIRTAGIRILGSYLNLINNNIVNGVAHTAGILGQNSPGNTYDCDSVTTTGTGLGVYTNSLYQLIRGNALDISDTCLTIRSVIGKQYYHGNKFYSGEAVAVGLDENEIENSRFFVNPTIPYHRPPEVEPVDWFKNETETSFWDECGNGHGGKGKGNTGFDDPVALGLYFDNLKQIESNDPELFFVRMIHLLLYDYARDDYTLPADITQDPVWDSHPDISQIADLINQVNGIAGLSENSLLTEDDLIQLSDLQDAYINAQDSIDKENAYNDLKALMETLQPAFEYEYMQDSIAYAQLQNQFDLMSGTDISGKWADIYDDYIDFVQKGEVVEDNKAPLEEYSRLCSDMYGDAIHLTRALVNTYDNTYFDVYDGCLDIPLEPRFKENTLKALVQPNPAKNNITIQFDNEVTGYLTIYDISGKQVMNRDIDKAKKVRLDLNLKEGVYFINIQSDTGEKYIDKIVVIK